MAIKANYLEEVVYKWAERAGLQLEREKPGLLFTQRPEETALGGAGLPMSLFLCLLEFQPHWT